MQLLVLNGVEVYSRFGIEDRYVLCMLRHCSPCWNITMAGEVITSVTGMVKYYHGGGGDH